MVSLVEAGTIIKTGFNSEGIAFVANALVSSNCRIGVPTHIMCHKILNSKNFYNAVNAVENCTRAGSLNLIIGSSNKESNKVEMVNIETNPTNINKIYPGNGILFHTNHYLSPILKKTDTLISQMPDSKVRYKVMKDYFDENKNNITLETFNQIFINHAGYPDSICRHINRDMSIQFQTNASIIMNIGSQTLEVTRGCPCCNKYIHYDFKNFLNNVS